MGRKFKAFADVLESEEFRSGKYVGFNDICRRIHCSPSSLRELVFQELGDSPEYLMEIYRC